MAESLTMNLRMELEKSNLMFHRWSSNEREWLKGSESVFHRQKEEYECTISALEENKNQLEASKVINDSIKKRQEEDIERCLKQNELLSKQKNALEIQLRSCEEEEERENRRLSDTRKEHEGIRRQIEQSLNDLTYGMRHYLALGLEFHKADDDCMKFSFTQIDQFEPMKVFYFVIYVDSNNSYQVVDSNPTLPKVAVEGCVDRLNINNDIGMFVFHMRELFRQSVI